MDVWVTGDYFVWFGTYGAGSAEVSLSAAGTAAPIVRRTFLGYVLDSGSVACLAPRCAGGEDVGPLVRGSILGIVEFILGRVVRGRKIAIIVYV